MLDEIKGRLEAEIDRLATELNVDLPDRIRIAVEHGDLRENAEYKAALERQVFVQTRLDQLSRRMNELSKIDVDDLPYDRVGFGSRVEVHDPVLDEHVTFTIVAGDFIDLDAGHISMASPIGRGLLGSRKGEEVAVQLPVGERRFKIVDLVTLPQQLDAGGDP